MPGALLIVIFALGDTHALAKCPAVYAEENVVRPRRALLCAFCDGAQGHRATGDSTAAN